MVGIPTRQRGRGTHSTLFSFHLSGPENPLSRRDRTTMLVRHWPDLSAPCFDRPNISRWESTASKHFNRKKMQQRDFGARHKHNMVPKFRTIAPREGPFHILSAGYKKMEIRSLRKKGDHYPCNKPLPRDLTKKILNLVQILRQPLGFRLPFIFTA